MGTSWSAGTVVAFGLILWVMGAFSQEVWTQRNPLPTDAHLHSIVWTGNQLVAVGSYGTIVTSPDGNSWTKQPSGSTKQLNDIAMS